MEKKNTEVSLTQYLMPNGQRREVFADVGETLANKAKGMILSCEILQTGKLAIYGRLKTDKEEDELCRLTLNEPGNFEPNEIVKEIIRELDMRRKSNESTD